MKNRKILVTGGTGYIGSHTTVELIQSGYDVVVVDNLSNSKEDVLEGIEKITGIRPSFEKADCTDFPSMKHIFDKYPDINAVIHFAAFKAVGESVVKPAEYYRNNLLSLINIVDLLKSRPEGGNIVFSSSCTVYGNPSPEDIPLRENTVFGQTPSPYGRTKQMSEQILMDSAKAYKDLNIVSLRYFNPIGAHPSALIGELPLGAPQNIMPVITQTAAGLRDQMQVFGADYNTQDGTCIRDYIYVCDLAKAHVAAIKRLFDNKSDRQSYETFNVGTGKGLSVMELIKMFEKISGTQLSYKISDRREGDAEQVWADPSKAEKILGWKADTPIEDIVNSAWVWEKRIRNIKDR